MTEKRVTVWVQRFKDRGALMLQWIDPETHRRKSKSAGTADEGDAEQARADLEYELNHGRYQEASRMSWERFRELFEAEYLPNLRPGSQGKMRDVLDSFAEICRPGRLRSVSERTLSAFVAGLRLRPGRGGNPTMAATTITSNLNYLRAALNWAARQKLIPVVPGFPAVKVPRKKPRPVPPESFERILDRAGDLQMRAYLLCGWLAGLRLNEAFCLEREATDKAPWVDFPRDRIWLPAGFVKAVEDQWVPLDPVLREALEALPHHGKRVFRFLAPDGHPVGVPAVSQRIIRIAKKAGVKLTMKVLRRGFGCYYAGKVPAQVLQKLMRHASITTTMDFYANVDQAAEEAVFNRQRNTSRNTPSPVPSNKEPAEVHNPC
jgi:integrase